MTPVLLLRRLAPLLLVALALFLHWSYFKWEVQMYALTGHVRLSLPSAKQYGEDADYAHLVLRDGVCRVTVLVRDEHRLWEQQFTASPDPPVRDVTSWEILSRRGGIVSVEAGDYGRGPVLSDAYLWYGLCLPLLLLCCALPLLPSRLRLLSALLIRKAGPLRAAVASGTLTAGQKLGLAVGGVAVLLLLVNIGLFLCITLVRCVP